MRKILVMLLVFALVIGCVGVVSATMSISGPSTGEVGKSVSFTVQNQDNITYSWTINGTDAGTGDSITKTFDSAGKFTVKVTASGNNVSATDATAEITIKPVALFTASQESGVAPLPVTFTFTGKPVTGATYLWKFEDGQTSTEASPTYNFTTAKKYSVSLVVTQNGVSSEVYSKDITVTGKVPETKINEVSPKTGMAPLTVTFKATAPNSDSVKWEFGDGENATNAETTHIYEKAGTYVANFTATNANGTSVKKQETITVNANTSKYSVAIDATPLNGTAPLKVNFKINTTIPSSDRLKIEWDFGNDDDDDAWSGKESDSYTYNKSGTYTVTLVITSKSSNTKYQAASVKITVADLMASFTASPESGPAPLKVTFTDTTKGSPTDWDWTIYRTDGGSRTIYKELSGKNPSYTFESQGTYEVELRATKDSKSATAYKTITVGAKATTAPTTVKTTVTTAPTTAATTMEVRAAALSDDSPVPNPMDIIEEFLRLLKVMLVPENYSLAP
ncbi:MAG: PKD domain-containing protein [Methanocorpusculum sp.]|nr:PKD domain-containing protein [Methanocorpusculum sp.]MDE2523188.1 PKD domain-containing protein [Methanocorpusculum sp.]MDE2525052.1 PKD domain-containing protein [Methanocorpusculum sp.]